MKKLQAGLLVGVALGLLWGAAAQAKLIPGTSNSLPRLVSARGTTYTLGKKPYPAGTRAAWIAAGRALAAAPDSVLPHRRSLKGAADNRAYLPPIGDQSSEGSCVHWAGSYYTKTANMKRMNPALNIAVSSNQCSPRFTYNLTNCGEDQGGWGHEPFEIAMRYGIASLAQKPYTAGQYTTLPVVADFIEGLHRRTTNYVWVWDWAPSATEINELKAWLDAGGIAVCGVYAEDTFDAWGAGDSPWTGATCTYDDINHMVTVCGYGSGYYLVVNQWGTSYGSNGFIVVDSDYFENYVSDVMYPLEGTYEPATNYAKLYISHGRRSDIRSLMFTVNGTLVWSNSLVSGNLPKDTGTFDTDTRSGWQLAVDLSSAPWTGANTVTARCMDNVSGTAGSLTNFTLRYVGVDYASTNVPVAIPDATGVAAAARVVTAFETSAPAFYALGAQTATAGVAMAFTVSASGYPSPVLALQTQTASSGYSFTPATGVLDYTAPEADLGARTFTFTASNVAGVATQTVNVTVVPPPPAAPAAVWASLTNSTDFTAAWSAVAGATDYRLDVGTNATFSAGGGSSGTLLEEGFDVGITAPAGWTFTAIGGIYNTSGNYGEASPSLKLDASGDAVQTPALSGPTNVSFWLKGQGATGSSLLVEVASGGAWSTLTTIASLPTTGTTYSYPVGSTVTNLRFTYTKDSGNLSFDDVKVTGASEVPSYVAGYSNLTVAGTSQSVTGLSLGKTYYFRVRAAGAGGTSPNSGVAAVTTLNVPTAPSFAAIPGQTATLAHEFTLNVSAYADGYPAPALSLTSSTANGADYSFAGGTLTYTPSVTGTFSFVFLASNASGTASATATVAAVEHTAANYGLYVGLNEYNTSYVPSDNWLSGCVPDANHVYSNTLQRGEWTVGTTTRMLNSAGTKAAIRTAISNYANTAVAGDTFLYFHSSHGGNHAADDYTNYTKSVYICTYNDDYEDTELAADLSRFATGVKVVVMVDACFSGGLFKTADGARTLVPTTDTFDLAANVTRLMEEERAARLAAGVKGADRTISAGEIGWITAADYWQYSWDGDDGGAFTEAAITGWTNGLCDNATYGNQDGYANFYELWNYAKDIAVGYPGEYDPNDGTSYQTDAQASNTNVLLNTLAGWVGAAAPGGLVVFSNMTAQTVVVGGTLTYPVGAYTAGTNVPATVTMTTVEFGASYAGGVLTFTPVADGNYTFNFTATNVNGGSASAALNVSATLAAPALAAATGIGNDRFTANWGAVTGAASYRLDVATADTFSAGGSGATETLAETPNASLNTGWEYVNSASNTGSAGKEYHKLVSASDPGVVSVAFSTVGYTNADAGFAVATFGGVGANGLVVSYSLDGGGNWARVATNTSASTSDYVSNQVIALPPAALNQASVRVKWHCPASTASVGLRLRALKVTGSQPAGGSTLVVSDRSIVGTSFQVTELSMNTPYYYRVRAVANTTGPNSATGTVTTTAEDSAPAFDPIPEQSAALSTLFTLNVGSYASGYPVPAISLVSSTANGADYSLAGGVLSYTPSATGTYSFVFLASNTLGTASATATVVVADAAITVPTASIANLSSNSFTVNWTATTGGSNYQVQVATDTNFTAPGRRGTMLTEDFATLTDNTPPAGWTSSKSSDLDYVDAKYCGAAAPAYKFGTSGQTLTSPTFSAGATNLQFFAYGNGSGTASTLAISGLVSGVWTLVDTESIAVSGATYRVALDTQTTQLKFVFTKSYNCALDDVVVQAGAGGGGSIILDQTVAALTYDVTGLTPSTPYHARVRAAGGEWSAIVSATTTAGGGGSGDLAVPVVQAATGIQATQFTANWLAASNATGYRLDVATNDAFRHGFARGATTLSAGDLMIVTADADTTEGFDAVPLVDLEAGTVVYFTDNGWSNSMWRTNEGTVTYTAPGAITAGTVLSYRSTNANGFVKSGSFDLSASGDTILAYQGSAGSPQFLYGIGWATNLPWVANCTGSGNSEIPAALSTGAYTIVACGASDNYQYNSASGTSGSKETLLQLVGNAANWVGSDTNAFAKFTPDFTISSGTPVNDYVPGYENHDVGNGTSCAVTGLTEGVTYYYRVRAYNASSNSANSGVTNVVTSTAATPPDITGFAAAAGDTAAVTVTDSVVGQMYWLEYTTNLLAMPVVWHEADSESGDGGEITLEDGDPADVQRFYRVVIP